jgi:NAD-dependent SIR2 family protein deacetylase
MATDSYYISFFFGAGASAEYGIPTMRRMATEYRNVVNENGEAAREQEIYNEIIGNLSDDMGAYISNKTKL